MELNTTALAKAGSTNTFKTISPTGVQDTEFTFFGNLNNETLTLKVLNPHSGGYEDVYLDAVITTYTNNSATEPNHICIRLPTEFTYKWTMSNGAGTVADVYVHGSGIKRA